jgi:hypothetical protein
MPVKIMIKENSGRLEGEMSGEVEEFVNKLQEIEELLINCRTPDDEITLTNLFEGLNTRICLNGKLLDEIEGNDDVWNRFKQAEDDFKAIRKRNQGVGASEAAEA